MKKIMLLAAMSVAAVAFAVPAAASAEEGAHFLHEGNPISGTKTTHLTGNLGFGFGSGSFNCNAHPTASIGTTSGTINEIGITTDSCITTGSLINCELVADGLTHGDGVNALTPAPNQNAIIVKNFKLTILFGGDNCALTNLPLELTFNEIELGVDNNAAISAINGVSGSGVLEIEGVGPIAAAEALTTEGLEVVEAGTIGIGFPT